MLQPLMKSYFEVPSPNGCWLNPMHPITNSLKKQKSMYIVLMRSIKPSIKSHKLMGILRAHTGVIGYIGIRFVAAAVRYYPRQRCAGSVFRP